MPATLSALLSCVVTGESSNMRRSNLFALSCLIPLALTALLVGTPSAGEDISIAVMDLEARGIDQTTAEYVSDRVRAELIGTGAFRVMERGPMLSALMEEQQFQMSGLCSEQSCLVEIGEIIGVQRIIGGSIYRIGPSYRIVLRLVNVETAELVLLEEERAANLDELTQAATNRLVSRIAAALGEAEQTGMSPHDAAQALRAQEEQRVREAERRRRDIEARRSRAALRERAIQACEQERQARVEQVQRGGRGRTALKITGSIVGMLSAAVVAAKEDWGIEVGGPAMVVGTLGGALIADGLWKAATIRARARGIQRIQQEQCACFHARLLEPLAYRSRRATGLRVSLPLE